MLKEAQAIHVRADTLANDLVFQQTFSLSEPKSGDFATINGFRIARREVAKKDLSWPEVNAAWGQVVSLLSAVSNLFEFSSTSYRLVFLGPASRVVLDPGKPSQEVCTLSANRQDSDRHLEKAIRCICSYCVELCKYLSEVKGFNPPFDLSMESFGGVNLLSVVRDDSTWNQVVIHWLVAFMAWLLQISEESQVAVVGQTWN